MSTDTTPASDTVWFKDVAVFDSRKGKLMSKSQVLVNDGLIASVTRGDKAPAGSKGARVIDGVGKTLMPGMIDAHYHTAFATIPIAVATTAPAGYIHVMQGRDAEATLLRGFTTVRDAGGPSFGLKRAVDEGSAPGPRIFPSGAFISQSGGHGDFRMPYEVPRGICGCLSHIEIIGGSVLCDGVPEVLRGAREQLMGGATQLKVMAGGGVASSYDPIDVTQFTFDEIRAAVETAENFGTYVMVHAYTSRAVQQCLNAGVMCIDHGQLVDETTVELMARKDAWWSLQPFLHDADMVPEPNPANFQKALEVAAGTDRAYTMARKHGITVAWGTDTLFNAHLATRQGEQVAKMVRWYTPSEVLKMVTFDNAQLLEMCGPRNPYADAPLGVVEKGAHADLLLIDGNPVKNIDLIADGESSMTVIMKGGTVFQDLTGG